MAQKNYASLNTIWNYEGNDFNCNGNHKHYRVVDEILIDDKNCFIIGFYAVSDDPIDFFPIGGSLIVWENERKVYFYQNNGFYLMYDFGLEVGDTIVHYDPINLPGFSLNFYDASTVEPVKYESEITEISTIEISGIEKKLFRTEMIFTQDYSGCKEMGYVIEDIGTMGMGLLGESCFYVAKGCFGNLQCYKNDSLLYNSEFLPQTPNPACELITSSKELQIENEILISPNPFDSYINIKTSIQIQNINIYTLDLSLLGTWKSDKQIDLSSIGSGILVVEIVTIDGRRYYRKIVKV